MWKFYFWVILILTVFGFFIFYGNLSSQAVKFGDFISVILSVLEVIGVYSFVFGKKILNPNFWKIVFWVVIVNLALDLLAYFTPLGSVLGSINFLSSNLPRSKYFAGQILGWLFEVPAYIAFYRLSLGIGGLSKK